MEYKGIITENRFIDGSWFTEFKSGSQILKIIEWRGTFSDDDIKNIIDTKILPFITRGA